MVLFKHIWEAFHGVTLFEGALFVAFSKDLYVWIHKNHKDLTGQEYINDNIWHLEVLPRQFVWFGLFQHGARLDSRFGELQK